MGGDMTVNTWISVDNNSSIKPQNANITMSTGADVFTQTAETRLWLDSSEVVVPCKVYSSLTTVTDTVRNPWAPSIVQVKGTNGMQFAPNMKADSGTNILVFSADVSKPLFFSYASENDDTYKGYET
jgi:hypothetical protein